MRVFAFFCVKEMSCLCERVEGFFSQERVFRFCLSLTELRLFFSETLVLLFLRGLPSFSLERVMFFFSSRVLSFNFLFRELSFSSLDGVELDFLTKVFF